MNDLTELDLVARLGRDTEPPTAEVRDAAHDALLRRIHDAAATGPDGAPAPAHLVRLPRRRRRALTAAGAAAVGIAASIVAVTVIAGPSLPGGLGAAPASAEARLLALASRVERTPASDRPTVRSTLSVTTTSTGTVTEARCTEISFSESDSASKCDDGRNADPITAFTASASGFNPSTRPDDIDAVLDRAVEDGTGDQGRQSVDPEQARRSALIYGFSQGGLQADTRAELVRRVAAVPGLEVEPGATTVLGEHGDRYTFPNGTGTFAVTLDPDDGSVLEFEITNAVEPGSGLPARQVLAGSRPGPLGDLDTDTDVRRLRDELISQGATLEATFPPPSLPGPSASCATPIDPLIGHVDAAAFGGWVGQHCTFSR